MALSGLVTATDWTKWTIGDLRPYVDIGLAASGPDWLVFGSD